ncbi:CBS domain-containing protein [Kribbella sp. NBC_00709]|uniref:CBS domain-containing protein n=1 Tax=Kribbella sp. NBC_00709 TaxID=2975972 RepID=UPI002E2B405A|nr:CBS domain-containing protein [Kribbella sp. NBC_00709]
MRTSELMTTPAITVLGETPVSEALGLLDRNQITAMPVVDRQSRLIGVVSEADLIPDALLVQDHVPSHPMKASISGRPRRVAELMVNLVMSVGADEDLDAAIDLLRTSMVKSLPVVEGDHVVGVISRSDVIHYLAGRDTRIRNEILDLLRERDLDWQVEVDDGIVHVRGAIGELERERAEAIAGSVRGVIAVHAA